jgi:hypothetical protein
MARTRPFWAAITLVSPPSFFSTPHNTLFSDFWEEVCALPPSFHHKPFFLGSLGGDLATLRQTCNHYLNNHFQALWARPDEGFGSIPFTTSKPFDTPHSHSNNRLGNGSSRRVWVAMLVLSITSNLLRPAIGELAALPSNALELEDLGGIGGSYLPYLVSGFSWVTGKMRDASTLCIRATSSSEPVARG